MEIEHKPVLLFTLVATLEDVLDYSRHTTNDLTGKFFKNTVFDVYI